MGLNCGIIKHADSAGISTPAAAASRRIDDDLGAPGIPGWEDQRDDPDQANRDPCRPDHQLPSPKEEVEQLTHVKCRRLMCVHSFVSAIRCDCHS